MSKVLLGQGTQTRIMRTT